MGNLKLFRALMELSFFWDNEKVWVRNIRENIDFLWVIINIWGIQLRFSEFSRYLWTFLSFRDFSNFCEFSQTFICFCEYNPNFHDLNWISLKSVNFPKFSIIHQIPATPTPQLIIYKISLNYSFPKNLTLIFPFQGR